MPLSTLVSLLCVENSLNAVPPGGGRRSPCPANCDFAFDTLHTTFVAAMAARDFQCRPQLRDLSGPRFAPDPLLYRQGVRALLHRRAESTRNRRASLRRPRSGCGGRLPLGV